MVSTWKTHCGVALYTERLCNELSLLTDLKIFAEELIPPQTETKPLNPFIIYNRCWKRYQGYETLQKKLLDYKPDIVHIQYVAGVYNELAYKPNSPFQKFIAVLRKNNIKIVLTLHDIPPWYPPLPQLSEWYKNLKAKFIVSNIDMSAGLREYYEKADINLIPLGTPHSIPIEQHEARKKLKVNTDDFLLTQVGFYGIDKGMLEIIKAAPDISIPNFKLVFAGGFHPLTVPIHRAHLKECIKTAIKLGLTKKIIFLNKILSEEEIDLWASASNFLILNQQMIFGASSSASAHRILPFGKPIIMSQSPKLSEFFHGIHCIKAEPNKISESVMKLYEDKELQKTLSDNAVKYAKKTSFKFVAEKHLEVYQK